MNELNKLRTRLVEISSKADSVGNTLDQVQDCSYLLYNTKIAGLPERSNMESAMVFNLLDEILEEIEIGKNITTGTA